MAKPGVEWEEKVINPEDFFANDDDDVPVVDAYAPELPKTLAGIGSLGGGGGSGNDTVATGASTIESGGMINSRKRHI